MAYDTHCDVEDSVVRKHFECATSYPEAFDELNGILEILTYRRIFQKISFD